MGLFGNNNNGPKCPNCGADARHYTQEGLCCNCGVIINQGQHDTYNRNVARTNAVNSAYDKLTSQVISNFGLYQIGTFGNINMYIDWNTDIIYIGVIEHISAPYVGITPWLSRRGNPIKLDMEGGLFVDVVTRDYPF